jgi:UDP-2,3-diacylglucosamine pyrophosphatase LpxH
MKWKKIVVISDLHIPGHHKVLFEKLTDFIADFKPDEFVINGDFLDVFSLSKYSKNNFGKLKLIDLSTEYEYGNEALDKLDKALGRGTKKYYLKGNHELRIETYMMEGDHIKVGKELTGLYEGLNLFKRRYTLYEDYMNDVHKVTNNLYITHDIGLSIHYGYNYLRKTDGHSIICGHTHRPQTITVGDRVAIGAGHMADIESQFMNYATRIQKAQWKHGFVVLYVNSQNDKWTYENVIVNNDIFVSSGIQYNVGV